MISIHALCLYLLISWFELYLNDIVAQNLAWNVSKTSFVLDGLMYI